MDWHKHARKWAENGGSASDMYEMPFSRLFAVYFVAPPAEQPIETVEDLRDIRNERRKKMGLPLIPQPKPKG